MTYTDEVKADNPSHFWPLLEVGGTVVADQIDVAGTGSSVNSSVGYRGIDPSVGAALINNVNNNAYLGLKSKLYVAPPCTFECWVWLWGTGGTYQECLMYGDTTKSLELQVQANGHWVMGLRGGSGGSPSTGILSVTGWHHLVALLSTSAVTLYTDGAYDVGPTAATYATIASDPFGIGGFTDRTQPLNGYISAPALYPSVLSAARILDHYNAASEKTATPIYQGGLTRVDLSGLQSDLDGKLDAILASVRKTYTAP